ncbi:MAG: alpha/beta hydrolase [Panacagrimonas sp.]
MSQQQLNAIIKDVVACFGAWTADTSLDQMRKEWDDLSSTVASPVGAKHETINAGGARAEWIVAPGAAADRVVMYLHGGGYVFGSSRSHGSLVAQLSASAQARALFVDYRLAPEHPFPAAVDDALTAYRWLLAQGYKPGRIAIAGDSAGGGLTFATLLAIKQAKLPMPACATPISPWVDMEASGETMISKAGDDPFVQKDLLKQLVGMYLANGDLRNPLASPLHGDLKGLPPLLIHVGSREVLLDDAVRIAQRAEQAGVPAKLVVWEGQIHVFHVFCPRLDEGVTALDQLGAFIRKHTG